MSGFATTEDLSDVVREALGSGYRITDAERLRGGTKKGVYRLRLDGGAAESVIVYRWTSGEDFWPETGEDDPTDPFAHASGPALFLAARRRLEGLGVRAPRLLWTDAGDDGGPAAASAVAVVEDVPGPTLETALEEEPARAAPALADLARSLDLMWHDRSPRYGRVDLLERGGASRGASCERLILDRALHDVAEAADRDTRIAEARNRLTDHLRRLAERVAPRTEYSLIHGELGPDHVLIDADGRAVLIDIEGLMYFDAEWEHVFLRLRFPGHYDVLRRPGLEPERLDLYELAMRLSLVAGPLRLLDGDFPDREVMMGIAEHNLKQSLALLP
ncbi:phosphotransferase [Nocardiopsis sp. Huas11]|uniref:phosphotransferase n=1 Tax=Nocardiopsis sp. Huas11 TaxID=2183912 RepID=UPI000EAE8601|nr:phosphotransferase [Nocardiopsis sp. Huas11]